MTAHTATCDGFEYVGRNSGRTLNPDDDSIDCQGACTRSDAPAPAPIHYMTGSSTVRCGAPMRHWRDRPDGWDLGTVTTSPGRATCTACRL